MGGFYNEWRDCASGGVIGDGSTTFVSSQLEVALLSCHLDWRWHYFRVISTGGGTTFVSSRLEVALPPEWIDLGEAIKKATLGSPFLDLSASVEMTE
jgi:hypothetical protein